MTHSPAPASQRHDGPKPPTPEQVKAAAAASGPAPSGPSVPLPPTPEAASAPDLCGLPHEYKTKTGETRSKPCIKARGHAGGHSSRNQAAKVDLSVIAGLELAAEEVEATDLLDQVTDRVRSAEQLRTDGHVTAGHGKWVAAGKPSGFNDAIKQGAASRYIVAPEQVAAVRALLRRAENAPELRGKVHVKIAPPKNHVNGSKMIYFVVVDKQTAVATPAAAPADATAATPAAAAPGPQTAPPAGPPTTGGKQK